MASLQELRSATDHFAAFGLERKLAIDLGELESRYAELTRLTHPDLAGSEPEDQLEAMDLSARVNEGYRVLVNDEARANYLLGLLGGPRADEDKSLPEGFLPIVMILREELAEAQLEGDGARVAAIEVDAKAQRAARLIEVGRLIEAGRLKEARMELNALRYYERLLEQVHPEDGGLL